MREEDFDDGAAPAAPDKLDALNRLLEEAIALEQTVEQLEDDLKVAKSALHKLRTIQIPDLMAELQMDAVTFRGWSVTVNDYVSGSLPKDGEAHERAIRWLEEAGAGGLIKTDVTLHFGRAEHNMAINVAERLREDGLEPELRSTVHTQTLLAWARERLRHGESLDVDVLGLHVGRTAKFKKIEK